MDSRVSNKHILVSRLRFMGDVILTTPLLHGLRHHFPDARIVYLAEHPYASLLEHHPAVDDILVLNRSNALDSFKLMLALIQGRFDIAIDLLGNPRSALLTFFSGAKMRIGGDFRGRRRLYTHPVQDDRHPKSAVDFHLQYLAPLGIEADPVDPYIVLTEAEETWAHDYLKMRGYIAGNRLIAIQAGASWPAKRWFPERFAELANRLVDQNNAQVFFVLSPGNEEVVDTIRKRCTFESEDPEVLPLRRLAAVLKQSDLMVSNDSGPMHLAPAVGTKTVGIFGPGEPEIWFPYRSGQGHRLVHRVVDCSRCRRDFCDRMDCMEAISVDEVYESVVSLL